MLELLSIVMFTSYFIQLFHVAVSVYGLYSNVNREVWINPPLSYDSRICVLIPAYMESVEGIERTFNSIVRQKYPRNLIRVIVIAEKDDVDTIRNIERCLPILKAYNIKYDLIIKNSPRSSKASSLNYVLKDVFEDVVCIYDVDDDVFDEYQIAKAVGMINSGYDALGVKVYRVGGGILQNLTTIDCIFWYEILLPALSRILGYPLISGEGLFITRRALNTVNGFPEALAEDAMLSIYFASKRLNVGLMNSIIYEKAPSNVLSLVKQRIRWHRGYFQCAYKTLKAKIPLKIKVILLITYLAPIGLFAVSIAFTYLVLTIVMSINNTITLWWSLAIILGSSLAPFSLIERHHKVSYTAMLLYTPYRIMLGFIAPLSLLIPKVKWYKTVRT
jgi:cellulose synthase/poly-beta-1,6-N-acetylglucosamine synthase-like glycosyltransferase